VEPASGGSGMVKDDKLTYVSRCKVCAKFRKTAPQNRHFCARISGTIRVHTYRMSIAVVPSTSDDGVNVSNQTLMTAVTEC